MEIAAGQSEPSPSRGGQTNLHPAQPPVADADAAAADPSPSTSLKTERIKELEIQIEASLARHLALSEKVDSLKKLRRSACAGLKSTLRMIKTIMLIAIVASAIVAYVFRNVFNEQPTRQLSHNSTSVDDGFASSPRSVFNGTLTAIEQLDLVLSNMRTNNRLGHSIINNNYNLTAYEQLLANLVYSLSVTILSNVRTLLVERLNQVEPLLDG